MGSKQNASLGRSDLLAFSVQSPHLVVTNRVKRLRVKAVMRLSGIWS